MNALEVQHLTKAFGVRKAVNDVSFTLPQGGFLSVFGPNGAGKTTLLHLLATLVRPSSGSIAIDGADPHEDAESVRARLGLISHQSMLYSDLTAEENLVFYGELYGITNPKDRARELLAAVGLSHRRLDTVGTFSRGMTQRVSIARALVHDPSIVLLDEPYSGLDPHATRVLDELIAEIREQRSFVMVSHDLSKGFDMATHVLVMNRGESTLFSRKDDISLDAFARLYHEKVGTERDT